MARKWGFVIQSFEAGMFGLVLSRVEDDGTVSARAEYQDVPVLAGSRGSLVLEPNVTQPALLLDIEGDGLAEFSVSANVPPQPEAFVSVLVRAVRSLSLPRGIERSFLAKLGAAARSLDRGDRNAARGQLGAFVNEVSAQEGKALAETEKGLLTRLAEGALAVLG
ncbi:hypothetical protein A3I40_02210 [Candidatus Uhrbacteria bacterium RIFCSPLOWO2_02_FULL_48_12]|uniref:Uncharacterized protein n=1 Tax=Candidatus Uhrbacteria bacterium RIFCSPLOWO2_02_FULL_48_12 TaxID=1802407 RepID=A0A1F7VB84_9BACT|nr:MAG: hypothetical protein A3I40_02210 [Candidatus Uhrbacteria bacterium RIFCSPLOWO2_02_FULL_48_12]